MAKTHDSEAPLDPEVERAMRTGSRDGIMRFLVGYRARLESGDPRHDTADLLEGHALRLGGQLAEARELLVTLLDRTADPSIRVRAAATISWVLRQQRLMDDSIEVLQRVQDDALAGGPRARASWAHQLASSLLFAGRLDEARMAAQMALHGAEPISRAYLLEVLGRIHRASGEVELAERHLEEAVAMWAHAGADEPAANALVSLADLARQQQRLDVAQEHLERALQMCKALDDAHFEVGPPLFNLGLAALERGQHELAAERFHTALAHFDRDGRVLFRAAAHLGLAATASVTSDGPSASEHTRHALAGLRGHGFYDRDLLWMALVAARGPGATAHHGLWTLVLDQALGLNDDAATEEARAALTGLAAPR